MLTRKNIKKFLEREHCEVIDNDLIDYVIRLSQGLGDFESYEKMLNAKSLMHDDDFCYYNIGLVAIYGLSAYRNDKEDMDFFKILVEEDQVMNEYWYQVICDGEKDGGEFFGSTAQECADYVRQLYTWCKVNKIIKEFEIVSILRVENEWE